MQCSRDIVERMVQWVFLATFCFFDLCVFTSFRSATELWVRTGWA